MRINIKENKKGFTLIELLAVIVILLVILSIATPPLLDLLTSSRSKTYNLTVDAIENAARVYFADHPENHVEGEEFFVSISELCTNEYLNCPVYNPDTEAEMNGYVRIIKDVNTYNYKYYEENIPSVNRPKLATGMTPIKWNGTAWENTTSGDMDWYDYGNKKWANAKTADGSFWVWIPRYIYKISSGWHSSTAGTIDIQFSKEADDNWNSLTIDNINTDITANASSNTWTKHPAFKFGTTELTGIWVAKFEATAAEGVANGYINGSCPTIGDDVTTKTVKIIPNAQSWRCINIGNVFTNTRNMETNNVYGWGTSGAGIDTHLIKNIEWGAVAYLSKSNYGKNAEITVNSNGNYYTGGGTSDAYVTNVDQSTTGNIYGIYDISGGTIEYVSAYVNNGNINLNQGSNIIGAATQYKDIYTAGVTDNQVNNYGLTINFKGDAIYETSSQPSGSYLWYSDNFYMPNSGGPWFVRGGNFSGGSSSGAFFISSSWGGTDNGFGFRPVVIINSGL